VVVRAPRRILPPLPVSETRVSTGFPSRSTEY